MKKITRRISLLLCIAMVFTLVGCGNKKTSDSNTQTGNDKENNTTSTPAVKEEDSDFAGTSIEFATLREGDTLEILRSLVADFEAETGVDVVLTEYPKGDYEQTMKTRMASGELPDIWETHGWSRLRYGEYLAPLNDEPWYNDMTDMAKGILEGEGNTGYALLMTGQVLGIVCNKTVAAENGVDVDKINTFDDFVAACQTLIDHDIVPLVNRGTAGDLTHVAGLFTSYPDALSVDGEAQLNGTWDWESFMTELHWFADLFDMGAFWKDRTTMTSAEDIERMASGKSVFFLANSTNYATSVVELNPENEYCIIPFPTIKEGAERYVFGGEGFALGMWNETKEEAACKVFLSYMAENGAPMVEAFGGIPGMKTYTVKESPAVNFVKTLFSLYPDAVYLNMWDREYMPSGMWPVFGEAAGMLYADHSQANLEAIIKLLKDNYIEKYAAAQSN